MAFLINEFDEALPSIVFFAAGFMFEFTGDYLGRFANYLLATTAAALAVGRAVLLANLLPFPRHLCVPPLIRPILSKTVVYAAATSAPELFAHAEAAKGTEQAPGYGVLSYGIGKPPGMLQGTARPVWSGRTALRG
jgi:hypothetical protein